MYRRKRFYLIISVIVIGAFLVFSRADNTSNKLYDAVAADSLTATYSGEHQDSLDNSGNEPIHYFAGSDAVNHNNVKLGDTCWQILRTTDTGGVKMIYNGPYDETNKCNTSRSTHKGVIGTDGTPKSLNGSYQYGDSYTYDETTGVFTLTNPTTATWSDSTYQNLLGKYTCGSTSNTCTTLYNVNGYYSSTTAYTTSYTIGDTHYSQIGTSAFNADSRFPAMVGYMFNIVYNYKLKSANTETMLSSTSLNTTYWYADSVTWGSPTASRYNLDNPYQVSSTSDYPNLVGKYTFRNTSQTYTNTSVYYIAAVNGSTMYGIQLTSFGRNYTLADFNYTYTYGDSYTDNGDGTYTITNQDGSQPTTINRSDWYTSYSNVENKYVCKNATNNTCSDLWYTTATSNTSMTYLNPITNNYKYANGFEYRLDPEDNTYKYFLNDDSVTFFNISDSTNQTSLNTHHYTCWNTNGKCTNISYIYYLSGTIRYYIDLTEGKDIEDAKNEMLYNNDVNRYNSSIKGVIEAWYHQNMTNYTDYLEDVIYCNDRTQSNESTNGWNPDGGSLTTYMYFKDCSTNTTLKCNNVTDQFTTTNTKAMLRYPVGLATLPEMNLLNNDNARKTGQSYWLLSPSNFVISAVVRLVNTTGDLYGSYVGGTSGSRPAVSLKPEVEYTEGDGSMNNPYVIDIKRKITTEVVHGTITETSEVSDGGSKTVSYSPDEGYVLKSIKVDGVDVDINDYSSSYTFSNVTTNHTIKVRYKSVNTLYDAVANDSLTEVYSGEHQDSIDDSGDDQIHYFTNSNDIVNHNNVKLGDTCWQILRTTDTGGVKMIYNGKYDSTNKCNTSRGTHKGLIGTNGTSTDLSGGEYLYGDITYNESTGVFTLTNTRSATWSSSTYQNLLGKYTCMSSSNTCTTIYYVGGYASNTNARTTSYTVGDTNYSQIGKGPFNASNNFAMVGYMSNKHYSTVGSSQATTAEAVLQSTTSLFTTSHYYGTSVSYSSSAYKLAGTINKTRAASRYTLRSTSNTATASTAYYITNVSGSTYYYLTLSGGTLLAAANKYYVYGDSYSGTSITSPSSVRSNTYYSNFSKLKGKYYCTGTSSSTTCTPKYAVYTTSTNIYYLSTSSARKYGSGVTYSNGTYTLTGVITGFPDATHHYTCFTTGTTCSTVYYVSYFGGTTANATTHRMELTSGKKIDNAVTDMLDASDVNKNNSAVKSQIEAWYGQNMTNYTKYLEDAVYCTDRTRTNQSSSAYDPSSSFSIMYFSDRNNNTNLKCSQTTDKFAVGNNKAKNKYPVGLATYAEMKLLDNDTARNTAQEEDYWLASPYGISSAAIPSNSLVDLDGQFDYNTVSNGDYGVRPVVSLKEDTEYISGTGTQTDPYVIDTRQTITTSANHGTITTTTKVDLGGNVTINYSPDTNYILESIKVDGEDVSISTYANSYTFNNVFDDHTIEVTYRKKNATFDTGQNVNVKMKTLAAGSSKTYTATDTLITAIKRADSLPAGFTPTTENTVSASTSELPIYIFFDDTDGAMYYYSEADTVYLNANSAHMFRFLENLTDISDLSSIDTSKATNMSYMFYGCNSLANINGTSSWDTSKVTNMSNIFYGCTNLSDINGVSDWDTSKVTDMSYMFYNCNSLANINSTSSWDTSKVGNMSNMFYGCSTLVNINGASNWNTSSVINMVSMFRGCSNLANISGASNWDTSRVTNMSYMFYGCTNLSNINGVSDWDTSTVTDMSYMFQNCTSLANINALYNWNVSNVTIMSYMFYRCSSLTNIDGASLWDTSRLGNMSYMFYQCTSLEDIDGASDWDISLVSEMGSIFSGCSNLTNIDALVDWDVSNVTTMTAMFSSCSSLEDVNGAKYWNTSRVTTISSMFNSCPKASGTIQILGNPTTYGSVFSNAATASGTEIIVNYNCGVTTKIDAIIATKSSSSHVVKGSCAKSAKTVFDTGQTVNAKMKNLANNSSSMTYSSNDTAIIAIKRSNSLPSGFTPTTANTVSTSGSEYPIYIYFDNTDGTMYYYSEADTVYLGADSSNMFDRFKGLTDISGLSEIDVSTTATMKSMFYACSLLEDIDSLEDWDTSKVTSMAHMFEYCTALENIDGASNWDTSKVTTMEYMFTNCTSLANIDGADNWDTSKVLYMGFMFEYCSSLTNIDGASNWDVSKVSSMQAMFYDCSSLEDIDGAANWNTVRVENIYTILYNCTKATGTIQMLGNPTTYTNAFLFTATDQGTQVTVKYGCNVTTKIDNIIATKSSNSNVVKASECTEVYRNFKIRNKTFGNMASSTKDFTYTVVVRDEEDTVVPSLGTTFTLKNDEREIVNIPDGYKITVTQDAETPYTTTVDNTNSRTITKTIDGDEDVIYKNTYDISVDTGVKTIIPPYIVLLLLSILTLLGIGYISKKLELD